MLSWEIPYLLQDNFTNKYDCKTPNKSTDSFLFFPRAKYIKDRKKSSKDIQNLQFVEIFKITTLQMQICACNILLSKEN